MGTSWQHLVKPFAEFKRNACSSLSMVQTEEPDLVTCPNCLNSMLKEANERGEQPGPLDEFDEDIENYRVMSYNELVVARRFMLQAVKKPEGYMTWRYRLSLFRLYERTETFMRNAGRALLRQHEDDQIQKQREIANRVRQERWQTLGDSSAQRTAEFLFPQEPLPIREMTPEEAAQEGRKLPVLEPAATTVTRMLIADQTVHGTTDRRNLRHWQENDQAWRGREVGHRHIKRKKTRPNRYD